MSWEIVNIKEQALQAPQIWFEVLSELKKLKIGSPKIAKKLASLLDAQTLNQSLKGLYEKEHITIEDALAAADNEDELKLELRGIKKGSSTGDFNFSKFERPKPKK